MTLRMRLFPYALKFNSPSECFVFSALQAILSAACIAIDIFLCWSFA
jgi:hypothetical protein